MNKASLPREVARRRCDGGSCADSVATSPNDCAYSNAATPSVTRATHGRHLPQEGGINNAQGGTSSTKARRSIFDR
ncbi:MAG: hypothetical protein LBP99_01700, partial [Azoarcus sp.]|nr:hypothetical protein [Azoarcus sp.]